MTGEETTFYEAVDTVEQLVDNIGYTETERVDLPPHATDADDASNGESADAESLSPSPQAIFANTQAGPDFAVIASPNQEYFRIQSSYPLWQDLAELLSPEKAAEIVPDGLADDIPEDHSVRTEVPPHVLKDEDKRLRVLGAFERLDNVDTELRKELVYKLSEIFTEAEVKHVINSPSDYGAPHGFTVHYKLFPYSEQFGPRELNSVIEKVRMATHHASLFLRYTFDVGVDIGRSTAGDIAAEPSTPGRSGNPKDLTDGTFNKGSNQ